MRPTRGSVEFPIPVYLPGTRAGERYDRVDGLASISEDGSTITIKLQHKEAGAHLAAAVLDGVLLAVGFDYQKPKEEY